MSSYPLTPSSKPHRCFYPLPLSMGHNSDSEHNLAESFSRRPNSWVISHCTINIPNLVRLVESNLRNPRAAHLVWGQWSHPTTLKSRLGKARGFIGEFHLYSVVSSLPGVIPRKPATQFLVLKSCCLVPAVPGASCGDDVRHEKEILSRNDGL